MNHLKISTPGRICLFGEHQDYLGLPVIAAGISKRVNITGTRRSDKLVYISMPDIDKEEFFEIKPELPYILERDYFRSVINVLQRLDYQFSTGFDIVVRGDIPINSGTSSSSALMVTWVNFLIRMAENPIIPTATLMAKLAYEAEVLEFSEPGGMMDQYSTALGDIIYLESKPKVQIKTYTPQLGTFVLGDSQEPKDTINILKHVKYGMLGVVDKIKSNEPNFDLLKATQFSANKFKDLLSSEEMLLLKGNLSDRDILSEAKEMLENNQVNAIRFGELLTLHQANLRDAKKISTAKINRMIDASLQAGALGAKINGSGGGGCMFAYAPNNPEAVAEAIEKEGGKAYIIEIGEGTRVEK